MLPVDADWCGFSNYLAAEKLTFGLPAPFKARLVLKFRLLRKQEKEFIPSHQQKFTPLVNGAKPREPSPFLRD